jgi:serine phosphatase RsbU (regulator of sigma subunit)
MRCAFSWITCPAPAPTSDTGDIACAVESQGAVRLLIGDVMGHGARAAQTAAEVTSAFRALAGGPAPCPPPHVIATRLHEFVAARDCGEEFVTALVVCVPMDDATAAEIACCGHPRPLRLRDGCATLLDAVPPSPPLGLFDLAAAQARTEPLPASPGDSLLLYTDGVTDARDPAGRPYPLAERAAALSADRWPLLQALRADLLRYTEGNFRDDATLLHLRFTRATAREDARDDAPGRPGALSFVRN